MVGLNKSVSTLNWWCFFQAYPQRGFKWGEFRTASCEHSKKIGIMKPKNHLTCKQGTRLDAQICGQSKEVQGTQSKALWDPASLRLGRRPAVRMTLYDESVLKLFGRYSKIGAPTSKLPHPPKITVKKPLSDFLQVCRLAKNFSRVFRQHKKNV